MNRPGAREFGGIGMGGSYIGGGGSGMGGTGKGDGVDIAVGLPSIPQHQSVRASNPKKMRIPSGIPIASGRISPSLETFVEIQLFLAASQR